jgi:hypothetical protein
MNGTKCTRHRHRAVRARRRVGLRHGMTILELNERFPSAADLDAAWARGIAAFARR